MIRPIRTGLLSFGLGALAIAGAQAWQVTLPLSQYEELRARANPRPEDPAPPPAPFALESVDYEIVAGPSSARIVQKLALTIHAEGWQAVPLGEAGSFTAARFGGLEGRVEVDPRRGWTLQARGRGRHEVVLESVVPVRRDETATRRAWRFDLRFPPAAVVRGGLRAPAEVEEAELAGGLVRQAPGGSGGGPWSFLASFRPDQASTFVLLGRRVLPERARLPLRFEATSASAALLSRTQLRVRGWIEARVAQGRLEELRVPLPEGLELVSVEGAIAGWDVADGALVVTPREPVEGALAVELELAGEPRAEFASPVFQPARSRRTSSFAKAALEGDGLLTLADPGAVRRPGEGEEPRLPDSIRGAGGALFALADPARPPRWQAEWAEETEVLAAQVDRLFVDVAVGEAGLVSYRLWAEVRNRGAQHLEVSLPGGFLPTSVRRDGDEVSAGAAASGGLAVPLLTREHAQVVYLAGLLTLPLPSGDGELLVPLPALSAPAARVEVRLVLPGGRGYRVADPTRADAFLPPPPSAARPPTAGNVLAQQVQLSPRRPPDPEEGVSPAPPGFRVLAAAWNALSASPGPLAVRVETEKEGTPWF
jgi:hypothetical protein